jgi:hypothetical protein
MVYLMNVLVEELCVQQSMNVIKADFLKPIVRAKLENENWKTRNDFCVVWHVITHNTVNQKECELCEYHSDDELVCETVEDNL